MSGLKARITGLGSYLPEKILSNSDLEKMVETSDDWILTRTGIKERRIASPEESASLMGVKAAQLALSKSNLTAEDIDMILVATMTPDYITPGTACLIQSKLQSTRAAAIDCQAACTGFLYCLSMAKAFIEAGIYKNILVVATEKMSSVIDYKDRNTCILFGDGAAAAVVSHFGNGLAIDTLSLGSDGDLADLIKVPAGGSSQPATKDSVDSGLHYLKMEGREVFKHAVRRMGAAAGQVLEKAKLTKDQITWLIPHQANIRIIDAIAKNLDIPEEKVYKTLQKFGNTSGSSIAIALDFLTKEKKIKTGDHLLLAAFGAGLTWGAVVLTQIKD